MRDFDEHEADLDEPEPVDLEAQRKAEDAAIAERDAKLRAAFHRHEQNEAENRMRRRFPRQLDQRVSRLRVALGDERP